MPQARDGLAGADRHARGLGDYTPSKLQRALLARRHAPSLIIHSDRSGQYVGNTYKALFKGAKAQRSRSRWGDYYDNAQAESRWSRLKTEKLKAHDRPVFADLAAVQVSGADYFDS